MTSRGRTGTRTRQVGALVLTAALATTATACSSPEPGPAPIRVERASVVQKVSASGALTSIDSQNLGFRTADRIKEINVKVGQPVVAGQVLAKLDPLRIGALRDQARGALDAALANLQAALDGVTVPNAIRLRDQAARSFQRTQGSVNAQIANARNNARQAEVKAAYDIRDLRTKNIRARASGCDTSRSDESNFKDTSTGPNPASTLTPPATSPTSGGTAASSAAASSAAAGSAPAAAPVPTGVGVGGLDPTGGMGDGSSMTASSNAGSATSSATGAASAPTCVIADQNAAVLAFTTALTSRTAFISAKKALDIAVTGAKVTIEASRTALITADTNLRTARVARPNTIDQLRALADSARAGLTIAEGNLEDTILVAPVGGVVAAINGTVGEFSGQGSGTSAQAPGIDAPIPGVGAAASSDAAGAAGSGISATRPGGAAFIQLANVNSYQVVIPLEETDGTRVKPGQKVDLTFDSLPGVNAEGTVLTVAPTGVNISGVTNYYATVVMNKADPQMRSGLTTQAGVMVNQLDNVITVPNSAVIKRDGRSLVLVPGPNPGDQPTEREFVPGEVGDITTEVLSGLDEGQMIVPPAPAAPSGTPN